jgi:hypothetical protein
MPSLYRHSHKTAISVGQASSGNNADEGDWKVLINRHRLTPEYNHQMHEVRGQTLQCSDSRRRVQLQQLSQSWTYKQDRIINYIK